MLNFDEARAWCNAALISLEIQLSPSNRAAVQHTRELLTWGRTANLLAQAYAFDLFAIRRARIYAKQGRTGCHGIDYRVMAFCSAVLRSVALYRAYNRMA